MPNIFPKRLLQDKDVLDPNDLNEDLQPIQSVVAGNLDAENIGGLFSYSGTTFKRAKVDKEAYYKLHSATGRTVSPDFLDGRDLAEGDRGVQQPKFDPDSPAPHVVIVPETNQWTSIDDLDVTITTGKSNLWINGIVQYVRNGWHLSGEPFSSDLADSIDPTAQPSQLGLHHVSNGFYPARIQFAIRINGRVIEWTVTGKTDIHETDSIGIKPVQSLVSGEDRLPGVTVAQSRLVAPGPEVLPIRLGTFFPVEPGTYKVEVVARRIPQRKNNSKLKDDVIGLFSRELHVLELPVHSIQGTETTMTAAQVYQFEEEELLDKLPNAVENTYEQCNNLTEGNIKREALFHTQLPSKVVDVKQSVLTFDPGEFGSEATHWPGVNSNAVTNASGGWGWYHLRNAAGRLAVSTTATFQDDDIIILMANIHLSALKPRGGAAPHPNFARFLDMFGAFSFGIRDSATSTGIEDWRINRIESPGNAVYVNSFQWCQVLGGFTTATSTGISTSGISKYFGDDSPESVDIPLFTVMRGEDFNKTAETHYIGVFGASMSALAGGPGTGPAYGSGTSGTTLRNPEFSWRGSNLIMIHLRK